MVAVIVLMVVVSAHLFSIGEPELAGCGCNKE
jgi:hypothetical protein